MNPSDCTFPASKDCNSEMGLSQRDYIAIEMAKALITLNPVGLQDNCSLPQWDTISKEAYKYADALIKQSNIEIK